MDWAQAFTTGGNSGGYTLSSVDVEFAALSDSSIFSSKLTATVRADSSGAPGAVVATLTNPAYMDVSADTVFSFAAPSGGVALDADTTYWVMLDVTSALTGVNALRTPASDGEDAGAVAGFSIANASYRRDAFTGTAWTAQAAGYSWGIGINGSVNPPPPPPPSSLVKNLGQNTAGGQSFGHDFAQAFTTGGNVSGYTLASVDVRFRRLSDSSVFSSPKITAAIWSDSGGAPGAAVTALVNPAFQSVNSDSTVRILSFAAPAGGIELAASTTYWLVMDSDGTHSGDNRFWLTDRGGEDAGAEPGFSIANDSSRRSATSTGGWSTHPFALMMRIKGTVNPPPPPSLVSNLGQADGGFLGLVPSDRAQAFSTGSSESGYTLGGVDVEFTALSDNQVFASKMTAAIWSDSGGAPGELVATLTNPAYQQTTADRVFGFDALAGGVALEADATYWLVLDSDGTLSGNHRVRSTASGGEDAAGEAGFSVADDSALRPATSTGGWSSSSESMKLAVRGAVKPPPPPMPESDGVYVVPHDWDLIPAGLDSGDEFRLMFVTANTRDATSSDIADYDSFVQSSAAGTMTGGSHAAIRRYSSLFKALGSTSTVDARDHLGMNPGNAAHNNAHVYWLNGGRIAFGNADVWDNTWTNGSKAQRRTELGTAPSSNVLVWTGTIAGPDASTAGTKQTSHHLGTTGTDVGAGSGNADTQAIVAGIGAKTTARHLYGVSPVFRVGLVPVPVSVDLSGVGSSVVERIEGQSVSFRVGLSRPLSDGESVSVPLDVSGASDAVNDFGVELTAGATNTGVSLDLSVAGRPEVVFAGAGAHAASVDLTLTADGVAESGSERLTVSLGSDSDFASQVRQGFTNVAGGAVRGRSTRFRVDVFDAGVRPWVQFRTCPQGVSCAADSDAGWVATAEGDALPVVLLFEGGSDVSYQFRLRAPQVAEFGEAWVQVARAHGDHMGVGARDRDRLICRSPANSHIPIGERLLANDSSGLLSDAQRTIRAHDLTNGCPHPIIFIGGSDKDDWQTVTVGSGDDPDAYDHSTALVHRVGMSGSSGRIDAGFGDVMLPVHIADDDAWEQDLEVSADGGATWTAVADGGFGAALNAALTPGQVHSFRVRLANDPASIPNAASQVYFTITSCTGDLRAPDGTSGSSQNRFRCLGPSHEAGITFPLGRTPRSSQRIGVTYGSPVTVNVHVGDGYAGPVHFQVYAANLWRRTDTDMPTYTGAPTSYRTQRFTYLKRFTACAGCATGFERSVYFASSDSTGFGGIGGGGTQGEVGELSAFDLSDTGIGLRWPAVTGADAYQVRWWPTAAATPGEPASASYTSALVQHPGHVLEGLEPATQYRARVYYFADGGVLLGSASPTIRFTTLPAGAPTQTAPTSPVLEPVPVASIAADGGNVVEGGTAAFAVTLAPPPAEPVTVNVEVGHYGDGSVIADADSGARTVTVPTSGTARFTVTTLDNTSPDANGPIHADVTAGDGYRLHQFDSRAVVFVDNDDDPKAQVTTIGISEVTDTTATIVWAPWGDGVSYQVGWYQSPGIPRLKYANTDGTSHQITGLEPESGYQVFVIASRGAAIIGTYTIAVATLAGGETETAEVEVTLPPPTPEISIAADTAAVTEGATAGFTITADPAPEADLQVAVTVAQSGDWGAAAGRRIVTVGTTGTATLTVATTNDGTDEADGSVTVTVDADYGYTVSPDSPSATVAVADDDTPQVSITADNAAVTEGGGAVFTITASPAPHRSLPVTVAVAQSGDWGAATGARTVTVGTTGTATLTVATVDDTVDEPDGAITAAVGTGSGYIVGVPGAASVSVADDDLPPVPSVSITSGGGGQRGRRRCVHDHCQPRPRVRSRCERCCLPERRLGRCDRAAHRHRSGIGQCHDDRGHRERRHRRGRRLGHRRARRRRRLRPGRARRGDCRGHRRRRPPDHDRRRPGRRHRRRRRGVHDHCQPRTAPQPRRDRRRLPDRRLGRRGGQTHRHRGHRRNRHAHRRHRERHRRRTRRGHHSRRRHRQRLHRGRARRCDGDRRRRRRPAPRTRNRAHRHRHRRRRNRRRRGRVPHHPLQSPRRGTRSELVRRARLPPPKRPGPGHLIGLLGHDRDHGVRTRNNRDDRRDLAQTRQPQRTRRTLRRRGIPARQLAPTRRHRNHDHHRRRLTPPPHQQPPAQPPGTNHLVSRVGDSPRYCLPPVRTSTSARVASSRYAKTATSNVIQR